MILELKFRGNPTVQGNSVLALAGLANAIAVERSQLRQDGKEDTPEQYISMHSWLLKVADTIMTVFDGNFKAKSKPFQWCQKVSAC